MFEHTVTRIGKAGTKRYIGMINVEVFDDSNYCEYVIDGGAIVWQYPQHSSTDAMDKAALNIAAEFEQTEPGE